MIVALLLAGACTLTSGAHTFNIDGQERTVLIRAPISGDAPHAAVFAFHGWGGHAKATLSAFADRVPDAFIIAPVGLPRTFGKMKRSHDGWQIKSGEFNDRDLRLFDAVVQRLTSEGCIDRARIASTGFSNGGMFTNLLACVRPLAFAAPVGGAAPPGQTRCRATPTLMVHGKSDRIVPFARAQEAAMKRRDANLCGDIATTTGCHQGACKTPFTLCVHEGRHVYPPAYQLQVQRALTQALSTSK